MAVLLTLSGAATLNYDAAFMIVRRQILRCIDSKAESLAARAFTLIELLVVLAVIVLLASLLMPALSAAKAHARFAKCKSNLRQIAIAMRMFVEDNETYPLYFMQGGDRPNLVLVCADTTLHLQQLEQ